MNYNKYFILLIPFVLGASDEGLLYRSTDEDDGFVIIDIDNHNTGQGENSSSDGEESDDSFIIKDGQKAYEQNSFLEECLQISESKDEDGANQYITIKIGGEKLSISSSSVSSSESDDEQHLNSESLRTSPVNMHCSEITSTNMHTALPSVSLASSLGSDDTDEIEESCCSYIESEKEALMYAVNWVKKNCYIATERVKEGCQYATKGSGNLVKYFLG